MAQTGPQKGLFRKAIDRAKELYGVAMSPVKKALDAVDNRVVQWKHGKHTDRRAEILKRVIDLPGGKALLKMAKENGVKIFVVPPRRIDKAKGRFSRGGGKKVIRVSNNGDIDLMTTTLWHELRHVEQHVQRGDMDGKSTRLKDTRLQHTLSLMHEADAFTQQAMLGLRQKKAGNPAYIDKMAARGGAANDVVREFLVKNPYESFEDETQFARQLFTEIMLRGMPGYNSRYFEGYNESFKKLETLESYRNVLAKRKAAPDFDGSEKLISAYGEKFMSSTSVRAIASSFLHAQPQKAYDALKLIEETAEKAGSMTEEEFQKARKEILRRTKSLASAFNKAALKYPAEPPKLLREAASAARPPVREAKRGVRAA